MGLVIEKTKSFPCVIVKKTFHVTCGVASFQIQKMKLILFCRVPASSRCQKDASNAKKKKKIGIVLNS